MIDPSKDKLAYFKDNFQTAEDKESFDASQYYYQREEFGGMLSESLAHSTSSSFFSLHGLNSNSNGLSSDNALSSDLNGNLSALHKSGMTSSFLAASGGRINSLSTPNGENLSIQRQHHVLDPVKDDKKAPDLSEFPALGSRLSSLALNEEMTGRSPYPSNDFVIQKEDFPALSPGGKKETRESEKKNIYSVENKSIGGNRRQLSGSGNTMNRSASLSHDDRLLNWSGNVFGSSMQSIQSKDWKPMSQDPSHQFMMLGMMDSLLQCNPEQRENSIVNYDLTSLGLPLHSSEPWFQTFVSPWAETAGTQAPQYNVPSSFYTPPLALKAAHLSKYCLGTLFYMFYHMPKDIMQAFAAQELYTRGWRYHSDSKIWFKHKSDSDFAGEFASEASDSAGNVEPYIYFDAETWQPRRFVGDMEPLIIGFISEDLIRVKSSMAS